MKTKASFRSKNHSGNNWFVYPNNSGIFAINVIVRAGAIHEPPHLAGISHLLEHLLFKSQNKSIRSKVHANGAKINAATSKDWTRYYVTASPDDYEMFVQMMYDVVFVFNISAGDVEKEKRIVLQEKNETTDDMDDLILGATFAGTPYAKNIIGSKKTICAPTLEDLRAYHRSRYLDNGCIVIATCPPSILSRVSGAVAQKFEDIGTPVPDIQYDYLIGRDNYCNGDDHDNSDENVDGYHEGGELFTAKNNNNNKHGSGPSTVSRCKSIVFSDPNDGGKGAGCQIVFRSFPYDRKVNIITTFVIESLTGDLMSDWYRRLREEKFHVYRFHMDHHETFGAAGALRICCVSDDDILTVFESLRKIMLRTLREGMFSGDSARKLGFEQMKRAFKTKMRGSYANNVTESLEKTTLDAFYTSGRFCSSFLDPTEDGQKREQHVPKTFSTLEEALDVIDRVSRDEVDTIAFEIFSHPLVVILGNNVSSCTPEKFEREAHRAVADMVKNIAALAPCEYTKQRKDSQKKGNQKKKNNPDELKKVADIATITVQKCP